MSIHAHHARSLGRQLWSRHAGTSRSETAMSVLTGVSAATAAAEGCSTEWSDDEMVAFRFYKEETASRMSAFINVELDLDTWYRSFPKAALYEPAIKHALCAVGSLHRSWTHGPENVSRSALLFAYQQYGKAIRHAVSISQIDHNMNNAGLAVCILLVVFELLLGDNGAADNNLQAGLKLLKHLEIAVEQNRSYMQAYERLACLPISVLGSILRDLERQAIGRKWSVPRLNQRQTALNISVTVPPFLSLVEASKALEKLTPMMLDVVLMPTWEFTSNGPETRSKILAWESHGQSAFRQWTTAFEALLRTLSPETTAINGPNQSTVLALHIWRIMFRITMRYDRSSGELGFDIFKDDFEVVVRYSAVVLRARQNKAKPCHCSLHSELRLSGRRSLSQQTSSKMNPHAGNDELERLGFSRVFNSGPHRPYDISLCDDTNLAAVRASYCAQSCAPLLSLEPSSLISALFCTVSKCRDPTVRRSAIRLLREYGSEDDPTISYLAALAGERIVRLEESGALCGPAGPFHTRQVERADQIPEEDRCNLVRIACQNPSIFQMDFVNTTRYSIGDQKSHHENDTFESYHGVGVVKETWALDSI